MKKTHNGSASLVALVIGSLALLGVVFVTLKLPPLGSQQVVTPIAPGSAASVDSLSVTGTATSSFSGGIDVLTVGGIETQSGLVVTGGDLLLTGLLKSNNTGTTSFSGGIDVLTAGGIETQSGLVVTGGDLLLTGLLKSNNVATTAFAGGVSISTAGGLSTVSGLTITGGRLLGTNIGATLGSTSVGGLTSANGYTLTAGCFLTPAGTCLGGGANPGGSANQFQYQVNGTTFGGSANLLFNSSGNIGVGTDTPGAILGVEGEAIIGGTLTVGRLVATSTIRWNTIEYTGPASQGAASTFLQNNGSGALTWATAGLSGNDGWQFLKSNITGAASSTITVGGLKSCDYYRVEISGIVISAGTNAGLNFPHPNGEMDRSAVYNSERIRTTAGASAVTELLSDTKITLNAGNTVTNNYDIFIMASTSPGVRWVSWTGINPGANPGAAPAMISGVGAWYNTVTALNAITLENQSTSTDTMASGVIMRVHGKNCTL